MINVDDFVKVIDSDFYTGVPDSQLKALCDYLMDTYGIDSKHHIIATNEGNATAILCGLLYGNRKGSCGVYAKQRGG